MTLQSQARRIIEINTYSQILDRAVALNGLVLNGKKSFVAFVPVDYKNLKWSGYITWGSQGEDFSLTVNDNGIVIFNSSLNVQKAGQLVVKILTEAHKRLEQKVYKVKRGGGKNSYPMLTAEKKDYPTNTSEKNIRAAINNGDFDSNFGDFLINTGHPSGIRCKSSR